MRLGAIVFLAAAAFGPPTWPRQPELYQAWARERDGQRGIRVGLGEGVFAARLEVEVRDADGRVLVHHDVSTRAPIAFLDWTGGSVGPWVVLLTLVDGEGRRSDTRRLVTDVDWFSANEQEGCQPLPAPARILGDPKQDLEAARLRTLDVCAPGARCPINVDQAPYWVGHMFTRNGVGATVLLRVGTVNAGAVAISIDSGARLQEPIYDLSWGNEVRVGCVDCRHGIDLPADRDVVLRLRLMRRGDAPGRIGYASSETKLVRIHTPARTYGRNGHAATDCWHPADEIHPPGPPAPTRWPLRVLLFAILPFLAGYSLELLRRRMSSPSSPCTARRKPKSRNSAIG